MTEPRVAGGGSRTAMGRASDGRPFKPYVYKGGDVEPPAVTAARERWRAHQAELDALAAAMTAEEAAPDPWPDYEWQREMCDD